MLQGGGSATCTRFDMDRIEQVCTITSMCSQSAPLDIIRWASDDKFAKSLDSMLGQIFAVSAIIT
jgi:hypothetical protein